MKVSTILWHLNRPWRTPVGKLVSAVLLCVGVYAGYHQIMEAANSVRAKGGDVRYDDTVQEKEARAVADFLVEEEYFSGSPATVRLTREDGVIIVQFVIKEEGVNDPEVQRGFSALAGIMSRRVFSGEKTVVRFCDDEMDDLKEFPAVDPGALLQVNLTEVYFQGGATEEQARALAVAMGAQANAERQLRFQLLKSGEDFIVKMVADAAAVQADPSMAGNAITFAAELSARAFNSARVEFHFCAPTFETYLSVASTDQIPVQPEAPVPAE